MTTLTGLLIVLAVGGGQAAPPTTEFDARLEEVEALSEDGRYAAAEALAREVVAAMEADRGIGASTIARGLDVLVDSLLANGKAWYPETVELADRAIDVRKKLKKNDPDRIWTLSNRAMIHLNSFGEEEEAIRLYRRGLEIAATRYGDDDEETVAPLLRLAGALIGEREYDEANVLLERARTIQEADPDTDPENLAWRLQCESRGHFARGDYGEAETKSRQALDLTRAALRPDHPILAYRLENLAGVLGERGSRTEALELSEQAREIADRELRPTHPSVARILVGVAYLHQSEGRNAKARELLQQALELREAEAYTDELIVAGALTNLAAADHYLGNTEKAIESTRRALELNEKRRGPDDPELVVLLNNLAAFYLQVGVPDQSFPLMERALQIQQKALGDDHPDLAKIMINMGGLYDAAGAYRDAQIFFTRALALQYVKLGKEHPDVAAALCSLALLVAKLGRQEEAVSLSTRSLDMARQPFVEGHPLFRRGVESLGGILASQGNLDEVEELLSHARAILASELGNEHERVAQVDQWRAELQLKRGELEVPAPISYSVAFPSPPQHAEIDDSESGIGALKTYLLEEDAASGTSLSAFRVFGYENDPPVDSLEEHAASYLAEIKRRFPDAEIEPVLHPDWVVEPLRKHGIPHVSFMGRHRESNDEGGRNIHDFLGLFFKTPDHLWSIMWNAPAEIIEGSMDVFGEFVSEIEFRESDESGIVASPPAPATPHEASMDDLSILLGKCISTTRMLLEQQMQVVPVVCMLKTDGSTVSLILFQEGEATENVLERWIGDFVDGDGLDDLQAIVVAAPETDAARFHLESRDGYCRTVRLPFEIKGKRKKRKVRIGEASEEAAECLAW